MNTPSISPGQGFYLAEGFHRRFPDVAEGAERLQQGLSLHGTDAGDFLQNGLQALFLPELFVIGDGEAVSFITDIL